MATQSKPGDIEHELSTAGLGHLVLNNKNYNLAELSDRFAAIHREVTDEYLARTRPATSWSGRAASATAAPPASARRSTFSSAAANVAALARRSVANVTTPARRRTAGNAAASRPFSNGQRVRKVNTSKTGTVDRLRDDEHERTKWAAGDGYYYSVTYDDGNFETYEAHSDLEPE
jgi:hypothetical protein